MSTEITNFIHGERVAAADGATTELIDPSTGEVFATAPLSRPGRRRRRVPGRRSARSRSGATPRPSERQRALLRIADAIEERADELVDGRVAEHRQAAAS